MPPGDYAAGVEGDGEAIDWRALNRANWDDRVPIHLASSFYDLAGFRAGASTFETTLLDWPSGGHGSLVEVLVEPASSGDTGTSC